MDELDKKLKKVLLTMCVTIGLLLFLYAFDVIMYDICLKIFGESKLLDNHMIRTIILAIFLDNYIRGKMK